MKDSEVRAAEYAAIAEYGARMSAKERVLAVYPYAFPYKGTTTHWRILRGGDSILREDVIGGHSTTKESAWENTASKLETK